jgi:hypothetical protein
MRCILGVASATLLGLVLGVAPVTGDPLHACRFFTPFTRWTANTSCPVSGQSLACNATADCADASAYCTFGGPAGTLTCDAAAPGEGKKCGLVMESWPTLTRAGGLCDNATETCAVCGAGSCSGLPMCVQARYCNGDSTPSNPLTCYFAGHDYP